MESSFLVFGREPPHLRILGQGLIPQVALCSFASSSTTAAGSRDVGKLSLRRQKHPLIQVGLAGCPNRAILQHLLSLCRRSLFYILASRTRTDDQPGENVIEKALSVQCVGSEEEVQCRKYRNPSSDQNDSIRKPCFGAGLGGLGDFRGGNLALRLTSLGPYAIDSFAPYFCQ